MYCNVISLLWNISSVPCEKNRKEVVAKRVNRYDESIDMYTEFFKPYELTSFDDTFCVAMTNSARSVPLTDADFLWTFSVGSVKMLKKHKNPFITAVLVCFVLGSLCQKVLVWITALSPCVNLKRPANPCSGEHVLFFVC